MYYLSQYDQVGKVAAVGESVSQSDDGEVQLKSHGKGGE